MANRKKLTNEELERLLHSSNVGDRCRVARHGYGLNKLINDENSDVRAAVANQGYGLD